MKICEIGTGSLPAVPNVIGGVEKYLYHLCTSLGDLGHDVTLIDVSCSNRPKANFNIEEVPAIFKEAKSLAIRTACGITFGYYSSNCLRYLLKKERFDVINFQGQFAALFGLRVARQFGIPSVFTLHNPSWSDESCALSITNKLKFCAERNAMKNVDHLICLSRAPANNVASCLKINPEKISVVPVGIQPLWFIKPELDSSIQDKYAPNNEAIVLNVGRVMPYKNQLAIVQAIPRVVKEIPKVKFVFVGPQDSPRYIKLLKKKLTDADVLRNVTFAGKIPLHELRQLYYLADVFVFPSLQENMPQALLEAMASAKAIIFSSIPPLKEVMSENAGIEIEPSDHIALSTSIIKLLRDQDLREKKGLNAQLYAYENFCWSSVAKKIVDSYSKFYSKARV